MTTPNTITPETPKAARAVDAAWSVLADTNRAVTCTKVAYDRARCDRAEARLAVKDAEQALRDAEMEARRS